MTFNWLPAAMVDLQDTGLTWTTTTHPKGVLHTEESGGWSTFAGWTDTPHAQVMPIPHVGVQVRQHIPFSHAAKALVHSSDPETNRLFAFQFELVGTCDPAQARSGMYYWPDADDVVLADLYAKVVGPLSVAYGIPVTAPPFVAYPASYGTFNGVRLTGPEWVTYTGWLGHSHVPENLHGDPGAFPWDRMIQAAGVDMPLTTDDLTSIAKTVETYFQVHVGNALETRDQALGEMYVMLQQLQAAVAGLQHGAPVTLSDAQVQALATATAAHLPAPATLTAGQVADELARRLVS